MSEENSVQEDQAPAVEQEEQQEQQETLELTPDQEEAKKYGWTTFEEYVEAGGNPDMYRGAAAFLQFKQRDNNWKSKMDGMQQQVETLIKGFESMTKRQQNEHKKQLEKAIKQARDDHDFDGYERASNELREIEQVDNSPKSKPETQGEPQTVKILRKANPIINPNSQKFDSEVNVFVEQTVNSSLGPNATDDDIVDAVNSAMAQAKVKFPQKFGGASRKPPTVSTPKKTDKSRDPVKNLTAEEKRTYNFLKDSVGEEAAKLFAEGTSNGKQ